MIRFERVRARRLSVSDLTVGRGFTAVIGPNGSGKTTFLELCAGIRLPEEGSVTIRGISPRDTDIGFVCEFPERASLFSRASDEIASPLRFSHVPGEEIGPRVRAVTQTLGIEPLLPRISRTLSGGEKALLAIATALVTSPAVLILDEYDSHLDWDSARRVRDAVRGADVDCLLQCTQNMDVAAEADCILYFDEGEVQLRGPPDAVFASLANTCFYPPSWRLAR